MAIKDSMWCLVLLYTNVIFYFNTNLKDEHYLIFISLMSITIYGYLILLETGILILILLIFFIILRFQKDHESNPIPKELLKKLVPVKYSAKTFGSDKTCKICLGEYTTDSMIIILPCHYKYSYT